MTSTCRIASRSWPDLIVGRRLRGPSWEGGRVLVPRMSLSSFGFADLQPTAGSAYLLAEPAVTLSRL